MAVRSGNHTVSGCSAPSTVMGAPAVPGSAGVLTDAGVPPTLTVAAISAPSFPPPSPVIPATAAVIPAKAGIHFNHESLWIPAFAGMTGQDDHSRVWLILTGSELEPRAVSTRNPVFCAVKVSMGTNVMQLTGSLPWFAGRLRIVCEAGRRCMAPGQKSRPALHVPDGRIGPRLRGFALLAGCRGVRFERAVFAATPPERTP